MAPQSSLIPGTQRTRKPTFSSDVQKVERHDTGEVYEQTVYTQKPAKARRPADARKSGEFFSLVYVEARQIPWRELTATDLRIILYVLTILSYNEPTPISQLAVARGLDSDKNAVNRGFRHLEKLGLIIQVDPRVYYLNPDYFWRGTGDARIIVRDQLVREGRIVKAQKVNPYA